MYENDTGNILFTNYGTCSSSNLENEKYIASSNLHKIARAKFRNILLS